MIHALRLPIAGIWLSASKIFNFQFSIVQAELTIKNQNATKPVYILKFTTHESPLTNQEEDSRLPNSNAYQKYSRFSTHN